MTLFALLPAAGKSTRMGRPKLALPLGDRTILEATVSSLLTAGVNHVLTVIGPHVPELIPLAQKAGARVLALAEETAEMRDTIVAGLNEIERLFQPIPNDWLILTPADHPTLSPAIVRNLLRARDEQPDVSILMPAFAGKRGHPTLFSWRHVAGLRSFPRGEGLNRYFRQHLSETLEVQTDDAEVLFDLDTPEDYEQLLRRHDADR